MFYIQDPKFWFYRSPVPPLPSAPPLPSPQWSSSSKCSCTMQDESKVCKSHFIWTSESRLSELILLDGQESLKCEPSDKFNNNASRLFKAIWDESVTKICMDKSHSKSSTLPVISGDAWRMMRVTQCYMCVCEGSSSPPVVRNKLGLWLDSSIWKSLAGGSERDILMVSLLIEIYWLRCTDGIIADCKLALLQQIETHWMQARSKNDIEAGSNMRLLQRKHVNTACQENCSHNGAINWK